MRSVGFGCTNYHRGVISTEPSADPAGRLYQFTASDDLTAEQIEAMYRNGMKMYPDFAPYYERNRYYSSVKPQMVLLVWDGEQLVADGKLLWRELQPEDGWPAITFFVFGFLVDSDYHHQGVGRRMLELYVEQSRTMGGDVLCGVSGNPVAIRLMERMGFQAITTMLSYSDALSGETVTVAGTGQSALALDLRAGVVHRINRGRTLHLGVGPL